MKQRIHIRMQQWLTLTIVWMLVGVFITVYDHLALHTRNSMGTTPGYSFLISLGYNLGSALVGALLGGSFLVFFINVRFRDKSYGYTILAVCLVYAVVISIIILLLGITTMLLQTGNYVPGMSFGSFFRKFLQDPSRLKNVLTWFIVVIATQFLLQISSKFGQGILRQIIIGRYNTPKAENRIFMFLDINSSTSIAEKLGNEKYHQLLKDFFADITNPILDNKGQIYQYVGDEVVVAWEHKDGIHNNHCLQCFFDIKKQIDNLRAKYLERYGFVPTFKAGLHCGNVIAGEVGILKRDITYSGDVLNTTARIMALCSRFKTELLVSQRLMNRLAMSDKFSSQGLGSTHLKGKEEEMELYAVGLQPFETVIHTEVQQLPKAFYRGLPIPGLNSFCDNMSDVLVSP